MSNQLSLFDPQPIQTTFTIPYMDQTQPKKKPEPTLNRTVEKKLAEIRRLHDELNETLYQTKPTELPQINDQKDVVFLFAPFLTNLDHEELWVMLLNTRMRVLKLVKVYSGSLNSASIRVGEIFKEAIRENAAQIILAHNHPSGDPSPSPDDVKTTQMVNKAGKLLDIELIDHIIIGSQNTRDPLPRNTSLKLRGLGFETT